MLNDDKGYKVDPFIVTKKGAIKSSNPIEAASAATRSILRFFAFVVIVSS